MKHITNVTTLDAWHKVQLSDTKYRDAYDNLRDEFSLIEELVKARLERRMTQAQLAERAGMKQAAIARLESGESNPSYKTLARVARALNKRVVFL